MARSGSSPLSRAALADEGLAAGAACGTALEALKECSEKRSGHRRRLERPRRTHSYHLPHSAEPWLTPSPSPSSHSLLARTGAGRQGLVRSSSRPASRSGYVSTPSPSSPRLAGLALSLTHYTSRAGQYAPPSGPPPPVGYGGQQQSQYGQPQQQQQAYGAPPVPGRGPLPQAPAQGGGGGGAVTVESILALLRFCVTDQKIQVRALSLLKIPLLLRPPHSSRLPSSSSFGTRPLVMEHRPSARTSALVAPSARADSSPDARRPSTPTLARSSLSPSASSRRAPCSRSPPSGACPWRSPSTSAS